MSNFSSARRDPSNEDPSNTERELKLKLPNGGYLERGGVSWQTFGRPDEPMSFDVSARGESSNTAPSPSTRHGCKSLADTPYKGPNEMREKIIRYEATEAGASCLSRTPSNSLAPPHLL